MNFKTDIKPLLLDKGKHQVFDRNESLHGSLEFTHQDYQLASVIFKNVKFRDSVFIHNIDLGIGIGFENCTFSGNVVFENVKCSGFDASFSQLSVSLLFKQCTFHNIIQLRGSETSIERDITFHECKINGGVEINEISITAQKISFDKCLINHFFQINDVKSKQGVSILNCVINTRLRVYRGEMDVITIIKSTFNQDIQMWGCSLKNGLIFNNGEYEHEIKIKAIKGDGTLSIIGGKFKEAVTIDYQDVSNNIISGFRKLYFDSCEFNNGLYVNGLQKWGIDEPFIERIDLKISTKLQGDINFAHMRVYKMFVSGINSKATINLLWISIHHFNIENFYNYSQLILTHVTSTYYDSKSLLTLNGEHIFSESHIKIENSNLGTAQFFQCDLNSFKHIFIHNSILSGITTANIVWFNPQKLLRYDEETLAQTETKILADEKKIIKNRNSNAMSYEYASRRETFRQLKYACDKQGDAIQALEFQKWEMVYYQKYLNIAKHTNWQDRFILYSSLTNNFGQSWFKPVWIGLIITFIFYIPIGLLGSENLQPSLSLDPKDIKLSISEVFNNQLSIYPQLLNPTHVLTRMYQQPHSLPGWIYFFDGLHRIITAFFIFQVISAFRKYTK